MSVKINGAHVLYCQLVCNDLPLYFGYIKSHRYILVQKKCQPGQVKRMCHAVNHYTVACNILLNTYIFIFISLCKWQLRVI